MTLTEQHTAWLKFHSFQSKIEIKFIPLVLKPMQEVVQKFIDAGLPSAQINDYIQLAGVLTPIINNLYYQCAYGYGYSVYKQYNNVKRFSPAEDIARYVINQLRLSLMNNVNGIEASIKDAILKAIQDGFDNGWSYEKTAQKVNSIVDIVRSRRIVRTESVKASNMSAIEGARRTGVLMDKRWISARDNRVRGNPAGLYPNSQFDHWDMQGQVVPMDRPFYLSGTDELQYPGDPNGSPGDIINCRCTIGFIPKRDENGRVIRAPQSLLAASVLE